MSDTRRKWLLKSSLDLEHGALLLALEVAIGGGISGAALEIPRLIIVTSMDPDLLPPRYSPSGAE